MTAVVGISFLHTTPSKRQLVGMHPVLPNVRDVSP